jgi:hypothetical protein
MGARTSEQSPKHKDRGGGGAGNCKALMRSTTMGSPQHEEAKLLEKPLMNCSRGKGEAVRWSTF